MLHVTPRGLGKLRREDPAGVEFLERHLIHTWKVEAEKIKEQRMAMRHRSRR